MRMLGYVTAPLCSAAVLACSGDVWVDGRYSNGGSGLDLSGPVLDRYR